MDLISGCWIVVVACTYESIYKGCGCYFLRNRLTVRWNGMYLPQDALKWVQGSILGLSELIVGSYTYPPMTQDRHGKSAMCSCKVVSMHYIPGVFIRIFGFKMMYLYSILSSQRVNPRPAAEIAVLRAGADQEQLPLSSSEHWEIARNAEVRRLPNMVRMC